MNSHIGSSLSFRIHSPKLRDGKRAFRPVLILISSKNSMKSDLIDIYFYFPETKPKNKQALVNFIVELMRKDGTIQYAGHADEKSLRKELLRHIGGYKAALIRNLSTKEKQAIEKSIHETVKKCNEILPLPTKNFIFVFPWFPLEEEMAFSGSFGFAAYSCVLHLFIALEAFTPEAIANSIAHEINHTISFYYHFERYGRWSLLDHIINEGLAENFREDVFKNTKPAPWAIALTEKEALSALKSISPLLDSKSHSTAQKILFGDKHYKRWTGYSIGYWLVKEFKKDQKLSWKEIMKTTPERILEPMIKNRA